MRCSSFLTSILLPLSTLAVPYERRAFTATKSLPESQDVASTADKASAPPLSASGPVPQAAPETSSNAHPQVPPAEVEKPLYDSYEAMILANTQRWTENDRAIKAQTARYKAAQEEAAAKTEPFLDLDTERYLKEQAAAGQSPADLARLRDNLDGAKEWVMANLQKARQDEMVAFLRGQRQQTAQNEAELQKSIESWAGQGSLNKNAGAGTSAAK